MPAGPDSTSGETTETTGHYASPEDLRIGLYVYIDLPWFRHPFTRSSFRISTAEQIGELRALEVARFRCDPQRSDVVPGGAVAVPAAAPAVPASAGAARDKLKPDADVAAAAVDSSVRQLRDYRGAAALMEKSFVKALGIARRLERNVVSRPRETLEEMGALVDQMVTVFLQRPEVTLQVMGENCGGEEAYHHGLNVAVLCMMLAKDLKLDSGQAAALATGALLHDLGHTEVPARILRKSADEQTRPERELRARHVEHGVRIGRQIGLGPEVLPIIAQHHELADGSGYPEGLRLGQIAPLARVVALVNCYDNLCNAVDFTQAMTPHEALSFIFARRKEQFDSMVLQLMIRALGVYPPGSIVKLSNETLAMVVSVNPHKPLRPWVLLHDAAVPREEAPLLNLEADRDVSISKAIRPGLLPAPVYAYLSPRKRISYFFDGGSSPPEARK